MKINMLHQGELLKSKINNSNVKVFELAEAIGMSRQNLYNLYLKAKVSREILEKICQFVHIDIDEFYEMSNMSKSVNKNDNDNDKELYQKLIEEKEKLLNEKDKLIQRLEKELDRRDRLEDGFFSDFKNFLRQYGSLGSEKKHSELEHSQPSTPTGQAPNFSGEAAAAGK